MKVEQMLSNSPGPMIRCTSMAAPMTSPESLSALSNSGCMVSISSWNRRKRRKRRKQTTRRLVTDQPFSVIGPLPTGGDGCLNL